MAAKLDVHRKAEAETVVGEAIAAGKINQADPAARARWVANVVSDRENALAMLNSIPSARARPGPGFDPDKLPGGKACTVAKMTGIERMAAGFQEQQRRG